MVFVRVLPRETAREMAPLHFGVLGQMRDRQVLLEEAHAIRPAPSGGVSIQGAKVIHAPMAKRRMLGFLQIDGATFYPLCGIQAHENMLGVEAIVSKPVRMNLAQKVRDRTDDGSPQPRGWWDLLPIPMPFIQRTETRQFFGQQDGPLLPVFLPTGKIERCDRWNGMRAITHDVLEFARERRNAANRMQQGPSDVILLSLQEDAYGSTVGQAQFTPRHAAPSAAIRIGLFKQRHLPIPKIVEL